MFQVLSENIGAIALLLLLMWGLQFAFTYIQMRRFYARLKIVRKAGLTAVGMAGSQYRGRAYAILTVDENKKVIHAEKMSGWSNFSGLRPVPELVGMSLGDILDKETQLPIPTKLSEAFRHAAAYINDARKERNLKTTDARGISAETKGGEEGGGGSVDKKDVSQVPTLDK